MGYNMKFLCLLIYIYICIYYGAPARLFTFGESEILSKEGTIQGNPISMGAYTLAILSMLHSLLDFVLTIEVQTKKLLLLMILQLLKN